MTSINNSLKSFNNSLKKTLNTNFSINSKFNLNKNLNNSLQNFIFFLALALSVGYLVNKQYFAIVLLYIIAILVFMVCKNIACSLGISIILTNLLLTLNIFNIKEGYSSKRGRSGLVELPCVCRLEQGDLQAGAPARQPPQRAHRPRQERRRRN